MPARAKYAACTPIWVGTAAARNLEVGVKNAGCSANGGWARAMARAWAARSASRPSR